MSADTLRRWDRAGKLRTVRDERNRRRVPEAEVARLSGRPQRHTRGRRRSRARNRFAGVVRSVEVDGVMALVEIEAGPFLVTAAVTRDAVEELGLAPGVPRDRRGQGDVGDGGAEMRRLLALLAGLARSLAGCGDDATVVGRRRRQAAARRLRRLVDEGGAHRLRAASSPTPTSGSSSPARTSWPRRSARASPVDVFAAANTKLPDALAGGGQARAARRVRHQPARARGARRRRRRSLARGPRGARASSS